MSSIIIILKCMRNFHCTSQLFKVQLNKKLLVEGVKCNLSSKPPPVVQENNDLEVIHRGSLTGIVKKVKIFSLSTSVMTLLAQPFVIPKALEAGGVGAATGIVLSFGMFAVLTPLLLHIITSRYITEICYDKNRNLYIASNWSVFLRKNKIEFTPKDVEKPGLSQLLTTIVVKGQPMFFTLEDFSDLTHYELIMGFDKPMDYGFDNPAKVVVVVDSSKPVKEKIKIKKAN